MNEEQLREAKKLFKEEEYSPSDTLVFIQSNGDITLLDDMEWEAGDSGTVSLIPLVYGIVCEEIEDDEEDGEEIFLQILDDTSDVNENVIGALVQMPTKNGRSHEKSPTVLNSSKEVTDLLEKWGME